MRFFFAICLYLFSTAAFANRLAVLDFTSVKADKAVLNVMAEMVRNEAANELAPIGVKVMDKANMLSLLQDQGKDATCITGQCEIDLGRNIGANYVLTGQLTLDEGDWILNLSLYETAGGTKIKGKTIIKESKKALRRALSDETRLLISALKTRGGQGRAIQEGFGGQDDAVWTPGGEAMVTVSFASEPAGATVLMDGDILCTTPCSRDVTKGAHQIRFSKERYVGESRDLMAKNGAKLSVRLRPKFGWFSVDSDPSGIALTLNGKAIGETPINRREIDPGVHKIAVDNHCFKPLSYRFQVKAEQDKADIPTFPLKVRQSAIQVFGTLGKNSILGDVYVDGKKVGPTGAVIKVPLCSKKVEIRSDTAQRWVTNLTLKEKELKIIQANMSGFYDNWIPEMEMALVSTSKLGLKTVYIPPGTFAMGSPPSEQGRQSDETQHKVRLTRGFYMMQSEVTQGLYQKVMSKNPSHFKSYFKSCGSNRPVEQVSWFDMVRFANALSQIEGLETCYQINEKEVSWPKGVACTGWRLPTEAEWEYAARGGQNHRYAGSNNLDEVAWYMYKKAGKRTHPVCQKKKNGYGLCDMSGNVWEWVWDWFGDYPTGSVSNPTGSSSTAERVVRGGSWDYGAPSSRVANRGKDPPSDTYHHVGARLVRTAAQ